MKLSKDQETEITKVYKTYFDSYVNGDAGTIADLLDDDYNQIGSADGEVFYNKKDALKFLHDTIDQVAGKTQLRNREIRVDPLGGYYLVTDLFDIYVLIDKDWSFYARLRASTLMQKQKEGWKFIHQHSSMPDSKTPEGGNISIEKIAEENLQLREAVKRRTIELEQKNRELEIEASLERVRSRTMAMYNSEELNQLIGQIYIELSGLDMVLTRTTLFIMEPDQKSTRWWMANSETPSEPVNFLVPFHTHPPYLEWLEAWQKGEEKWVYHLEGKVKEEWDAYIFSETEVSQLPDQVIEGMRKRNHVILTASCGDFGCLMPASLEPLSDEQIDILIRFKKVFEQSYTRFQDLKKAEAQAREAQIEVALERIRSRTMAMHKSVELAETAAELFTQFNELGVKPERMNIGIVKEKDKIIEFWSTEQGGKKINQLFKSGIAEKTTISKLYKSWKAGKKSLVIELTGKALSEWIQYLTKVIGLPFKEELIHDKRFHSTAFFTHGMILMSTPEPLAAETLSLLPRFARVFEQTYTRFLDLQKAEAQAREAQIEAALEKVRSRSLGMHKAEELGEVATVVFEKLRELNIPVEDGVALVSHIEGSKDQIEWMENPGYSSALKVYLAYFDHPILYDYWKAKNKGLDFIAPRYTAEENKSFLNHIFEHSDFKHTPKEIKDYCLGAKTYSYSAAFQKNSSIFINDYSGRSLTEQEIDIVKRFSKVFEQAYVRFLDLQKAEAQAREAQIEAALERVRSRSIAMRKSEEIADIAGKIFSELRQLDLLLNRVLIWTFNDTEKYITWWSSNPEVESTAESYRIDYNDNPVFINYLEAWQQRKPIYLFTLSGDTKKFWEDYLFEHTEMSRLPMAVRKGMRAEGTLYTVSVISDYGLMMSGSFEPLSEVNIDIIQRFGRVFQQSYTRYLDVQKAEAQAREAKIEAALERVRAAGMAMHSSEDLAEASTILFEQLVELGIEARRVGFALPDDDKNEFTVWSTIRGDDGKASLLSAFFYYDQHPIYPKMIENWHAGNKLFRSELHGKDVQDYYKSWNKTFETPKALLKSVKENTSEYSQFAYFKQGIIYAFSAQPLSEEQNQLLLRFANAFELTYTRFLDLQKAELQTREAQIEAGLEKVRSTSLSMQSTSELQQVVDVVFAELKKLSIGMDHTAIVTLIEDSKDYNVWVGSADANFTTVSRIPYNNLTQVQKDYNEMIENRPSFLSKAYSGQIKKEYSRYLFSQTGFKDNTPEKELRLMMDAESLITSIAMLQNTGIQIVSYKEHKFSESDERILSRFANVFEQAYTRFLDLQKAEVQAREAEIEAALERVRSKAMAMHNSSDLSSAASVVFAELRKLGIHTIRSGISLQFKEHRKNLLYTCTSSGSEENLSLVGWAVLDDHPVLSDIYNYWKRGEDYFPVMRGEILRSYYGKIKSSFVVPSEHEKYEEQFGFFMVFTHGMFYGWAETPLAEDQKFILKRFASTVDLTFKRYFDLQKTEAQAREAVKQASLDRVRGEIASMRNSEDLNRITPVIWNELKVLEVPFFRCGVFIVDDQSKKINCYLSNPEGESLAAWNSDYDTTPLFEETVKAWKKQQIYWTEWNKKQFMEFSQILVDQGLVVDVDRYLAGKNAPNYLSLQMIPFKQGMLYVGSAEKLVDDELTLVQSLASTFSIAYSRYEDFRLLEKAKTEVENALSELRSTQTQLIQAEKMASLGELTAGIAHEIQNPLNFVNNFSEVSKELIEELKEERDKRNGERDEGMEKEIIEDIILNLEKINHHGQRASSIVKGMLEHSRTSKNEKELTDLNNLADEYLRLAYHGLRAKDKSFNADFRTELDDSLPKVKVIGQDIGRVLLNLINNAFYEVSKRSKETSSDYKPEVILKSKTNDKTIEITIQDNGGGIPKDVLDKIFQPFYTTKPAGQGTGLGLSLSYDIITKGHNGHLEVKTKEGIGTEFTIQIPIS